MMTMNIMNADIVKYSKKKNGDTSDTALRGR